MIRRNIDLMKNTIILSVGQIIPKFINIIILPLLTTYLSQKDYGLYELTLSVASFCIPILSVQIQQAVFRYLIDSNSRQQSIITSSLLFIVIMFILFALPIIIIWELYSNNIMMSIIFYVAYISEMLLSWAGQVTRGLGSNIAYSFAYILYSILFVFLLVISFIFYKKLFIENVVMSMIVSYFFSFLFLLIYQKIYKYLSFKFFSIHILKKLLLYSAPMVISSISLWIVNLSDRFFISGYLGIEMTAIYAVANKIPNLFNSIYNIFNLAWTENTSKLTNKEKKGNYYSNFFKYFYQIMVGLMSILICLSPLLFNILINNKYTDSYYLMSWLYVGVFFSSLVSFFGSIYVGEKRTTNVGISSAIGAIINIVINLFFMRKFGIIIAPISTIISFVIICIYRAIDIKKYVNICYNFINILIGLFVILFIALLNYEFSILSTFITMLITLIYNIFYNKIVFIRAAKSVYLRLRRRTK